MFHIPSAQSNSPREEMVQSSTFSTLHAQGPARWEGLSVCKIQEWHPDAEIHPAPTLKGGTAPPNKHKKIK